MIDSIIGKIFEFLWMKVMAPLLMDKYTREIKDNFLTRGESVNVLHDYVEVTSDTDRDRLLKYIKNSDERLVSELISGIDDIFKKYTNRISTSDEMEQILFNVSKSDKMFDNMEFPYVYKHRAYVEINTLIIKTIY